MDLRKPIGWLFTAIGIILIAIGAMGTKTPMTAGGILDRQGGNLNLYWGIFTLLFGIVMWIFAVRSEKSDS